MKKEFLKYGKKKTDGFTFVETLSVLAITAVLTAGTTVSATKLISYAKKTACKNQIQQYCSALQSYFLDCGRFPSEEQGLQALWEKPVLYPVPENWNGPYIDHKPAQDPWGTDFKYYNKESRNLADEVPENLPYGLKSFGADKSLGGDGDDADINSWD